MLLVILCVLNFKIISYSSIIELPARGVPMNSCLCMDPSACFYVCNQFFLESVLLCFFSEILLSDSNLEIEINERDRFSRKILVCPKMGNNRVFWAFMNFVITFCWKLFEIKDLNNSLFSSAISISGKILHKLLTEILSSNQIRLQDSLIINISARNESISFDFLNKDIVQGKVAFETTILCWMCPDMPSQAQTWLDLLWVPLVGLGVRPT